MNLTSHHLFLAAMLFASLAGAQPVYESRDRAGPVFSDLPSQGASEVKLPPANLMDSPQVAPVLGGEGRWARRLAATASRRTTSCVSGRRLALETRHAHDAYGDGEFADDGPGGRFRTRGLADRREAVAGARATCRFWRAWPVRWWCPSCRSSTSNSTARHSPCAVPRCPGWKANSRQPGSSACAWPLPTGRR
jgi:hypothetical protein